MKRLLTLTSVLLTSGLTAFAGVTPTYDSIGTISGATFGGSGNPDTSVAITTVGDVTLGLQAQQRYSNPPLTSSGGVYYATPGENYGESTPPSSYEGATWDFDFYIGVNSGIVASGDTFTLSYGLDTGTLLTIDPLAISDNQTTSTTAQNGENLLFSTFGTSVPNALSFNPNANGVYDFVLEAYDSDGNLLGETAINVDVGSVPDAASSALLLGLGVSALVAFGSKQNRLQLAK